MKLTKEGIIGLILELGGSFYQTLPNEIYGVEVKKLYRKTKNDLISLAQEMYSRRNNFKFWGLKNKMVMDEILTLNHPE